MIEGLPGVLGKKRGNIHRREHARDREPIFREQGRKTLHVKGLKRDKQIY